MSSAHSIDGVPEWRPAWWLVVRELLALWRVVLSLRTVPAQPTWRSDVPATLLVPGFLAGDWSMRPAARHLRRRGFRTHRSGITVNVGCTTAMVERLERRLVRVAATEGPIVLVGHSRGGTLARLVAARRPDLVLRVVTLGSPLSHQLAASAQILGVAEAIAHRNVDADPRWLDADCLRGECAERIGRALEDPLPEGVPLTSVHTRGDGIVAWRACLAPGASPVRVRGSHNGLASNTAALRVVVRLLKSPPLPPGSPSTSTTPTGPAVPHTT